MIGGGSTTTLKAVLLGEDKSMGDAFDNVSKKADGADKKLGGFGAAFGKLGIAGIVAGAGAAVVGFAAQSVTAASDLNETLNKSNTIFGKNAKQIEDWGGTAAMTLGMSKNEAIGAAASFGDMFLQLGFAGDKATKMSKDVVQLSADLGSFNNLPTADVSERIAAAFRGEYDSLQALIPNINAARVEKEALATTGKKTAKSLTASEKAAAVLAIVMKDGKRAMGDFAKTSDGAANQQKIITAAFEDTKAEVGQALLPILTDLGKWFIKEGIPAIKDATKWWNDHSAQIQDGAATIGRVIGFLAKTWVASMRGIKGGIEAVGRVFTWLWNNIAYPVVTKIIDGLTWLTRAWATMLRGLSKVPGFGWAKDAADKLDRGADEADKFRDRLQRIPTKKNTTITAATGSAMSAVGALQIKIRNTKGKTVTLKVRYTTEGRLPNGGLSLAGGILRAGGGPVFGPGTRTSDSIPAWLSNDEHVLSADEVDGLGGHGAVEALRRAAREGRLAGVIRRAQGGPVGSSSPSSRAALASMGAGGDIVVHVEAITRLDGRDIHRSLKTHRVRIGQPLGLEEKVR